MSPGENGWEDWSKHVLAELQRHTDGLSKAQDTVNRIEVEIAVLKYKSGLWGAVAGLASVAIMLGLAWLSGMGKR